MLRVVVGAADIWRKISITTKDVAIAMVKNTFKKTDKAVEILENNEIGRIAKHD